MKKRKSICTFSILLSLLSFGCQSVVQKDYWYSPESTLEQALADCKECKHEARAKANEGHYLRFRDSIENDDQSFFGMELLETSNRDLDERIFFDKCMKARGYRRIREDRLSPEARKGSALGGGTIQYLAGDVY